MSGLRELPDTGRVSTATAGSPSDPGAPRHGRPAAVADDGPRGGRGRAPRLADVLTWLALTAAVLGPTIPLRSLVDPSAWWSDTVLTLIVATATLAIARPRSRGLGRPSLIAGGVALIALLALENPEQRWLVLPSPAALLAVPGRVSHALGEMTTQAPPVTAEAGLGLIVGAAALVAFLLAEALAVGSRAPALAGLPLLLLWTPVLLWGALVPGAAIALTIVAYVVVLAAQARLPSREPASAAAIATSLVCAMIAGAIALALVPRVAALDVPRTYADVVALGSGQRLDLGINMRDDLVRGANNSVFSYSGMTPEELGPLHTHTLSRFNGRTWLPNPDQSDEIRLTTQLWPTAVDPSGERDRVTIEPPDSSQRRLPVPERPRVSDEPVGYLPERDEVVLPEEGLSADDDRSVTLTLAERPDDLDYWRGLDPSTLEQSQRYLDVPNTGLEDEIAALTEEIVADSASPYEQVLAIQNYLRNGSEFQYTTSVGPQRTPDAVWDFLTDGRGYCVQFATSMVIMVRTLGIEARMAVGYLPGDETDEGAGGTVRAHDAHAWPQVRFPDAGWVRFEPTPADRTETAPEWAPDPQDDPTAEPTTEEPSTEPTSTEPSESTTDESSSGSASAGSSEARPDQGARLLTVLTVLAVAAAAAVLLLRRQRHARREPTIADAWERAVMGLERAGLVEAHGLTPLEIARVGAARLEQSSSTGADGEPIATEGAAALRSLAEAVSDERYRRTGTGATGDQVRRWADTLETALEHLRSRARAGRGAG